MSRISSNASSGPRVPASEPVSPRGVTAIKDAIAHGNADAVHGRLNRAPFSPETWQKLLRHAFARGSNQAIMKALLQHRSSDPRYALELAVRHNDLAVATEAMLQGADPARAGAPGDTDDMRALLACVRRKNMLYLSGAVQGRESDLDRALRKMPESGAYSAADALLRQAIGDTPLCEAWRDAVKAKRCDIQRAILLLRADQDRYFRVLEEDRVTDKAIAAVMKEIPYFSPKRGLPQALNRMVTFSGTEQDIRCRNLVEHRQKVQERSRGNKFDYAHYADEDAIAARISIETEANYMHLKRHADEVRLFHNRDFGKTLAGQFDAMASKKEPNRLLLLTSGNHAMSVGLKIKKTEKGKPQYVVEFFDPNRINSHVRVASSKLSTIKALTLKNLIATNDAYNNYYPGPDELSAIFVRPSVQQEAAGTSHASGAIPDRTLTSGIEYKNPSVAAIFHLLSHGFGGDLRRLKTEIASRPVEERIRLVEARNADRVPGLYSAFYHGDADVFAAYAELMELVPARKRAALAAAKRADGVPGLHMALQGGRAPAIRAFGKVLEQVPLAERAKLLAANRPSDGTPGLAMAFENGHADAIEAFGELLDLVPPSERVSLLMAPYAGQLPGLSHAMENGHGNAVRAFGKLLKKVAPEHRAELLAAKDADGNPALHYALQEDHPDAVKAFGELLELVPLKERVSLLSATASDGIPILASALKNGKRKAADQFVEIAKNTAIALDGRERDEFMLYIRNILTPYRSQTR